MKKKNSLHIVASAVLLVVLIGCATRHRTEQRDLYGTTRLSTWHEPAPEGMLRIPRGSITMGTDSLDSIWGMPRISRTVSVESFWMDRHEVTNAEYRRFVYYVRDSILRERLADPAYGGDERYKRYEDKAGEPITPVLDWSVPLPREQRATEEELKAINSLYYTNPITGERRLDARQLLYRYEQYDHLAAARYEHLLRPKLRNEAWHTQPDLPMITKDTAYIEPGGRVVRRQVTRRLSSAYDFVNTYIVAIHPDEEVWTTDWPEANNAIYQRRYFSHPAYDRYPVVGVTWEQATAYCAWRTARFMQDNKIPEGQIVEPYRLPTEAEYEYAARAGNNQQYYPWSAEGMLDSEDCLCGNFMPAVGNYTADKHLITAPVASYAPNAYGLYDLGGNVAEWTSSAWALSALQGRDGINPEQEHSADQAGLYSMARKVVKGGSWKDIAKYVRANSRAMEYQDRPRSYIGFRCVRSVVIP